MADAHGSHGSPDSKAAHTHAEPEEDPLRTPGWMPLVGFGLLLTGALWMYLFVSPGVMSPPTNADAGAETGAP